MEVKDMTDNQLIRYLLSAKEELKYKQSEIKQLEEEIAKRYKEGGYSDGTLQETK